jgi:peptidoglycan-N-acetylmuramic acid deacetylase
MLENLTDDQITAEIRNWEKTAERVLGADYVKKMKKEFPYLRLPGGSGKANKNVLRLVARLGYWPIGWSDDTYSTIIKSHEKEPVNQISNKIVAHLIANSQNGSIILLHFNSWDTMEVERTIDGLIAKGLQLKKVSDII